MAQRGRNTFYFFFKFYSFFCCSKRSLAQRRTCQLNFKKKRRGLSRLFSNAIFDCHELGIGFFLAIHNEALAVHYASNQARFSEFPEVSEFNLEKALNDCERSALEALNQGRRKVEVDRPLINGGTFICARWFNRCARHVRRAVSVQKLHLFKS